MTSREDMTPADVEHLSRYLEDLEKQLGELQLFKGEEAVFAGDQWHDNPVLYRVESDERALIRQIAELRYRLKNVDVIDPGGKSREVTVGSVVRLEFDDGRVRDLQVCGTAVKRPSGQFVSAMSPLGQSLVGARAGDERIYYVGAQAKTVKIVDVLGLWRQQEDP